MSNPLRVPGGIADRRWRTGNERKQRESLQMRCLDNGLDIRDRALRRRLGDTAI
jgi:hypothetical protein